MTRVAFTVFGVDGWTGGVNYFRNLFSALSEIPDRGVTPILFVAPETPPDLYADLLPYLPEPPVVVAGWSGDRRVRRRRLWHSSILQNDVVSLEAFRRERIDVVFVHAAWYGLRFSIPTIAWIADFQHRHLPQMFSASNRLRRDLGYLALSRCATTVLLSSEDARGDCERFYPMSRGKTSVLPFAVRMDPLALQGDAGAVARRYQLPKRFFYMPNQLWKHKNHLNVIEALRLLRDRGSDVVVVASGNPNDKRNPEYPEQVLAAVKAHGLADTWRFLGLIPYADLMFLMRGSLAVVNASLFEGWSTTVEEAKAVGVPLLLSDLAVHREQTREGGARYFDPNSPTAIADVLAAAWRDWSQDRALHEVEAARRYGVQRSRFASDFAAQVEVVRSA